MELRTGKVQQGTLCYLMSARHGVCLAEKKLRIGQGKVTGYGGGVEEGESVAEAAIRELVQESRVSASPSDLVPRAILTIHNILDHGLSVARIHVFTLAQWQGDPEETDEMGPPFWYPSYNLPYPDLMPAEGEWLPLIMDGFSFAGQIYYGKGLRCLCLASRYQIAGQEACVLL